MNRDFDGADWAHSHSQLSDGISATFAKLAIVFKRLNAIQYDAPWQRKRCKE